MKPEPGQSPLKVIISGSVSAAQTVLRIVTVGGIENVVAPLIYLGESDLR
jgi:hypothetical protein